VTLLAIHRSATLSLATDDLLIDPDDVIACEAALQLLDQAQQIAATRQQQLAEALQQARNEGWEAGRAEALATCAPQLLDGWRQAALQARSDAEALRHALVLLGQQMVLRIAASIGAPDFVSALARDAVKALVPDTHTVVRVHPDVAEAAQRHLAGEAPDSEREHLEVRPDAALDLFDCVVETAQGQLLASLPTQLDRLGQHLKGAATAGVHR
jgi:flagellar biosynthesis/type III secretory pathway protein FliH